MKIVSRVLDWSLHADGVALELTIYWISLEPAIVGHSELMYRLVYSINIAVGFSFIVSFNRTQLKICSGNYREDCTPIGLSDLIDSW